MSTCTSYTEESPAECPKIVLMSATLDAELFNRYFGGAPSVKFPGRAFPVTDLYLEDALELTRHSIRPGNKRPGASLKDPISLKAKRFQPLTPESEFIAFNLNLTF